MASRSAGHLFIRRSLYVLGGFAIAAAGLALFRAGALGDSPNYFVIESRSVGGGSLEESCIIQTMSSLGPVSPNRSGRSRARSNDEYYLVTHADEFTKPGILVVRREGAFEVEAEWLNPALDASATREARALAERLMSECALRRSWRVEHATAARGGRL